MSGEREHLNRRLLRARDAMDRRHGRDFGIRDPFGNHVRIGDVRP